MITKTVQNAINEQINKELYSSYLYLSMAAYFEDKNLPGFANWMYVQAEEERGHGMKLFEHLLERSGKVELKSIAALKPHGTQAWRFSSMSRSMKRRLLLPSIPCTS